MTDPLSRGFGIPNRSPDPLDKGLADIIQFQGGGEEFIDNHGNVLGAQKKREGGSESE
jgi:hypothetical protein